MRLSHSPECGASLTRAPTVTHPHCSELRERDVAPDVRRVESQLHDQAHVMVRTRYAGGAEDSGAEEEDEKDEEMLLRRSGGGEPEQVEACQGRRRLARCFGD